MCATASARSTACRCPRCALTGAAGRVHASTHVQVKVCRDTLCWYCPRIVAHLPLNIDFFPFYTVADGDNGWVPVHERHAEMHHEDEAVRALAHDLYVTDKWLPDNCVKRAWRSMPLCSPFRARLIASATNLSERTVVAMFLKLNEEEARRTDIARACEACASEAIDDPQLGAMLFCDHMEHTRTCNAAWHQSCCPQPLQSIPKGKWFCPTHAGTHASFPAFAVITAHTTQQVPLSTRKEPIGAHGDAQRAATATTTLAGPDSASQNGTAVPDSGDDSEQSESDEESRSDADAGAGLPVWAQLPNPVTGTCPLCSEKRRLPWSTHVSTTNTDVAVCGRCHSYHERNDRILF